MGQRILRYASLDDVMIQGVLALLMAASVGVKLAGVHLAGRVLKWKDGEASLIGWRELPRRLPCLASLMLDSILASSRAW